MLPIKQQSRVTHFTKASAIWIISMTFLFAVLNLGVPGARGQAFGPGYAISLNGTNGYVQVTNGIYFSGDFTIEGWVFSAATTVGHVSSILPMVPTPTMSIWL